MQHPHSLYLIILVLIYCILPECSFAQDKPGSNYQIAEFEHFVKVYVDVDEGSSRSFFNELLQDKKQLQEYFSEHLHIVDLHGKMVHLKRVINTDSSSTQLIYDNSGYGIASVRGTCFLNTDQDINHFILKTFHGEIRKFQTTLENPTYHVASIERVNPVLAWSGTAAVFLIAMMSIFLKWKQSLVRR